MTRRRRAATLAACPSCGSADLARIVYGLPMESAALHKAVARGKVVLGGCCVADDDPEWHCNACHTEFTPSLRRSRSAPHTPK